MRALLSSVAAAAFVALGVVHQAHAHYTFPDWVGDNNVESTDWEYIRMTANHIDNGPLTDVTSPLLRCYENSTAASTGITTAEAGNTYSFMSDAVMGHPGVFFVYMANVADLTSESAGDGDVWFKVYQNAPYWNATAYEFEFPYINGWNITFTIPKATPSGNYLIRAEQIALHVASVYGGAQFYIACAQVTVTGGGSGTPGPLVAIPGVYTGYEPGILINIYETPADGAYDPPGPAVWTGTTSTGSGSTTTTTTTKASSTSTTSKASTSSTAKTTTSTTTVKTSTTTSSSAASTATGTVAEYGQCGGSGYTGSTVCASPYTCTYENDYYSQCL